MILFYIVMDIARCENFSGQVKRCFTNETCGFEKFQQKDGI